MEIECSHRPRGCTLSKSLSAPPKTVLSGGSAEATHCYAVYCSRSVAYTMPVLQAFGRTFKITVEVDGKAKEEFVDSRGQTWIAVEPGSAFQVKAEAEHDPSVRGENYHRLQLTLDGQDVYWYCFDARAKTQRFVGYDTVGDGPEILAFKFGEPGEEASGNRADALEITVTAQRAIETTELIDHSTLALTIPDGSKRCKKFYQPHVEAGDVIDSDVGTKATYVYRVIDDERVVCSVKYATVEGLAIRGVVSRTTHPHLFDDKKSRKHRAARSPLVKEESPAKKAKPEVIEIE